MASFIGSTATTATRAALTTASFITSFSLANKTGGATTVSVGLLYGSTFYILYTHPLAAAGAANSEYIYSGKPILIPTGYQIFISASGQTDYIFTISPNNLNDGGS